jgi:aspartyl-tRNA(Asn)/glutamyl-tRNA(Gln) amidotransferase subunit A
MAHDDLCFHSIAELASLMRARTVSPVEVTEAHLARIERLNPTLNAFVTIMAAEAREAARRAEAELAAGCWRGPLHGVPIGLKDIFDTAGVRTTHGSSFFRDNVPTEDAESVRRLRDAGAVLIGKCNMHEFAVGSTTNNPWYGATRNPWALDRSPGGSSGGSAASVAAFLCAGATGTDTGGSIRGPAARCGIVGLKPTYGRVSLRGIHPYALSLDHAGPLTRTARDAGLMLGAMAGYDRRDPTSADIPVVDFTVGIDAGVSGLRLALCPDLHFIELDPAVARALDEATKVLAGLGAKLDTVRFPLAAEVRATREALSRGELITVHRSRFAAHPKGYGTDLRERLMDGTRVTLDAYVRACRMREAIRREFDEILRSVDAFVLPVAPREAPPIATGQHLTEVLSAAQADRRRAARRLGIGLASLYRKLRGPEDDATPPPASRVKGDEVKQVINIAGLPAVAVPIGFGEAGLPLSMQVVGPAWAEARILRIAHAYEVATAEIRQRRPPEPPPVALASRPRVG